MTRSNVRWYWTAAVLYLLTPVLYAVGIVVSGSVSTARGADATNVVMSLGLILLTLLAVASSIPGHVGVFRGSKWVWGLTGIQVLCCLPTVIGSAMFWWDMTVGGANGIGDILLIWLGLLLNLGAMVLTLVLALVFSGRRPRAIGPVAHG